MQSVLSMILRARGGGEGVPLILRPLFRGDHDIVLYSLLLGNPLLVARRCCIPFKLVLFVRGYIYTFYRVLY